VRQFIEEVVSPQWAGNRGPQCGIWIEGVLAGSIGCHAIDWANRTCSLGYWIESRRQGQGIVTRCGGRDAELPFR
jgi:ribosomal-protein-serine acetyltransferase